VRVYALSDIHVDYPANMNWIEGISKTDYLEDTLVLPGDATHHLDRLEQTLTTLRTKFANVCFVPGNHELWLQQSDCADSIEKFQQVLDLCTRIGVHTRPVRLGTDPAAVWIVPLFTWYVKPEEGEGTLFGPKPGEDPALTAWSDNYFVKWPELRDAETPAAWFLALNEPNLQRTYDAPVITISHFLPRQELIFSTPEERGNWKGPVGDPHSSFNFSRVAGDSRIDDQIRALGAKVHVYGHQHRNRFRHIDGVLYVSHCLGYSREREMGAVTGLDGPRLIWAGGFPARADGSAVVATTC